jgi:hypothetical protein
VSQLVRLPLLRAPATRPVPARASTGSRPRSPCSSPLVTCWGRCCSPMSAFSTSAVPVSPGITHRSTVSCRCAPARSGGSHPRSGAALHRRVASLHEPFPERPRIGRGRQGQAGQRRLGHGGAGHSALRGQAALVAGQPPARWAAIPARFTGVQRAQPALATRSRWSGASTTAAAPLRPTTPISEPPNQGARRRSCRTGRKCCPEPCQPPPMRSFQHANCAFAGCLAATTARCRSQTTTLRIGGGCGAH